MTEQPPDMYVSDNGEGSSILYVHPGFTNRRIWEQHRHRLPQGYQSVAVDLVGHGNSPRPLNDYSLQRFASDIHSVIRHRELEDVTFVGWSLSSHVALAYLREFGDRIGRLVLLSTGMFRELANVSSQEYYLDQSTLIERMETEYPEVMMDINERLAGPNLGRESLRWLWQMGLETPVHAAIQIMEEIQGTDYDTMRETIKEVDIPIAIFHGAHDNAADLEEAAYVADELCSDGRFVGFERSGHFIPLVEPKRFDEELLSFINY